MKDLEHLLKFDFQQFYETRKNLDSACFSQCTEAIFFELYDEDRKITICEPGKGTASYINKSCHQVTLVEFDRFVNDVRLESKRCDGIIYTDTIFTLNELRTSENNNRNKRIPKAIKQLEITLLLISQVPSIMFFINKRVKRECLIFIKKPKSPAQEINAIVAFNRNQIETEGIMPNSVLSHYGFILRRIDYPNPYQIS
ncbi:MAG: hypothetical protein QM528_08215 [Phycisphaerales bacterium]|nr:hypothetical protein [Phycisphaerales bacterium]